MRIEAVDWVEIPAGVVRRGTPADDIPLVAERYADTGVPVEWYLKEAPSTEIRLPAFRLARTRSRSASGPSSPRPPAGRCQRLRTTIRSPA